MNSLRFHLLFLSILNLFLHAQDPPLLPVLPVTLPDVAYIAAISQADGYSPATGFSHSAFTSGNPAALVLMNSTGFGIALSYRQRISYLDDIGLEQPLRALPQNAGFAGKMRGWHYGVGFYHRHYADFDLGELTSTTVGNDDWPALEIEMRRGIWVSGLSVARMVYADSQRGINFAVGGQLSGNVLWSYEEISGATATVNDLEFTGKAGFLLTYADFLKFGAAIENGAIFEGNYERRGRNFLTIDPGSNANETGPPYKNEEPTRAQIGLSLRLTNFLAANIAVLPILRKDNTYRENDTDVNVSLAGNYAAWKSVIGVYILHRGFVQPVEPRVDEALIVYLGIARDFGRFSVSFDYADSHFLTDENRQTRILRLGAGYALR